MRIISGVLAVGLVFSLVACGDDDSTGSDPPAQTPSSTETTLSEPRLVIEWGEGKWRDQSAWLEAHTEPKLLEGTSEIDQFVAGLPEEFLESAMPLQDVDATTEALLVAGFANCGKQGEARVDGETVSFVVRTAKDIQCVWAPLQVQVWAVPTGLTLAK
ncbi:hypothetical protein ACLM5J_06965 [Nocardioides sp. Bht2]|uniref:hypothetical protein n=1 Tax=Nocardioides sp. Bht2 TaxID=3392297 RepID=UPI0039B5ECBA